jgi:hypothetical protein
MAVKEAVKRVVGVFTDHDAKRAVLHEQLADIDQRHRETAERLTADYAVAHAERFGPEVRRLKALAARMAESQRHQRERANVESLLRAVPMAPALARLSRDVDAHLHRLGERWKALDATPGPAGQAQYPPLRDKTLALQDIRRRAERLHVSPLAGESLDVAIGQLQSDVDSVLAAPDVDADLLAALERQDRIHQGLL